MYKKIALSLMMLMSTPHLSALDILPSRDSRAIQEEEESLSDKVWSVAPYVLLFAVSYYCYTAHTRINELKTQIDSLKTDSDKQIKEVRAQQNVLNAWTFNRSHHQHRPPAPAPAIVASASANAHPTPASAPDDKHDVPATSSVAAATAPAPQGFFLTHVLAHQTAIGTANGAEAESAAATSTPSTTIRHNSNSISRTPTPDNTTGSGDDSEDYTSLPNAPAPTES
jgi:hypothetical protein